jgi:Cu-Zn family superoxide dismutase
VPCEGLSACEAAPTAAGGTFTASASSNVGGAARFMQEGAAVHVTVVVQGLAPGTYGVHIHEKGDCSAPDFSSAGAHFNPTNAPHACPPTEPRHAGDLGNIVVGADGNGLLDLRTSDVSLGPGARSVLGRAVIVHAMKDDCMTQPSGASGARIGCAVINAR